MTEVRAHDLLKAALAMLHSAVQAMLCGLHSGDRNADGISVLAGVHAIFSHVRTASLDHEQKMASF